LYDARGILRGLAQADWVNAKEQPYIHFNTRFDSHVVGSDGEISAKDRQTGAFIKTMPAATVMDPKLKSFLDEDGGVWHGHYLFVQTWHNLEDWLDENYPLWREPLAYWD
jgi:hypothetical protein